MSEESGQDKTEEPTAQRLKKAREDGQIARSQELAPAAMMVIATMFFSMMGHHIFSSMSNLFKSQLQFDRRITDKAELLPAIFGSSIVDGFLIVLPLMAILYVIAILSTTLAGGLIFSPKMVLPNFGKLSIMSGIGRMFGARAAVELLKAILKFTLVATVLWSLVTRQMDQMMQLGQMAVEPALVSAGWMIGESALWLSLSLLVIALIDAPYQRYSFIKRMRMTKQEVKDEMKDMEGRPEVKQQIRRRQREMANNRMIQKVKDADVVITNPEHFAVALSYDPTGDGAPVLLAKGTDHMAARIREEAQKHGVEMFAAPPLARALYFSTEVDHPVPESLYLAVAQVIAYIFSLADVRPGVPPMPKPQPKVPPSMLFDANGLKISSP